jgi:hypothetical protein
MILLKDIAAPRRAKSSTAKVDPKRLTPSKDKVDPSREICVKPWRSQGGSNPKQTALLLSEPSF